MQALNVLIGKETILLGAKVILIIKKLMMVKKKKYVVLVNYLLFVQERFELKHREKLCVRENFIFN